MSEINKNLDGAGKINFNFTTEQQVKFDEIYAETKRLYPELCGDDISLHRTKVLIAHSVLTNDAPLFKEQNKEQDKEQDKDVVKIDLDDLK
jgi:hypothetical protein